MVRARCTVSNFTRDMQRRRREMDTGWVVNTTPIRDSLISLPTPAPLMDPSTAVGLALASIEAAIASYGPHSDALGSHLQEARAQLLAALRALSSA